MGAKLAVQLAASREAKGLPRINVAAVDTSESAWLTKRFGISSVPIVLLFKGGIMYSFGGGGFSVERLMQFAERDYERSSRMLVPPEPHVATPHDQTFLITQSTAAPCAVGAGLSCGSRLQTTSCANGAQPWVCAREEGNHRCNS